MRVKIENQMIKNCNNSSNQWEIASRINPLHE